MDSLIHSPLVEALWIEQHLCRLLFLYVYILFVQLLLLPALWLLLRSMVVVWVPENTKQWKKGFAAVKCGKWQAGTGTVEVWTGIRKSNRENPKANPFCHCSSGGTQMNGRC